MKKWTKVLLALSGTLGVLILAFVAFVWISFDLNLGVESWESRKPRFEDAAERGMIVVEAIERFQEEHNQLPGSLEVLVPDYLPDNLSTGLSEYPDYEYHIFTDSKSSLVWYDLGSRNGKPMSGLWVYIDGDPEHAILALTIDEKDRITDARVDRMPEEHDEIGFDSEKWARHESRIAMARSIPKHLSLKDAELEDVKEVLGEPDGSRVLRDTPWELRIECPNGIINWDVFIYWPTQEYPKYIYGGSTERIGKWWLSLGSWSRFIQTSEVTIPVTQVDSCKQIHTTLLPRAAMSGNPRLKMQRMPMEKKP